MQRPVAGRDARGAVCAAFARRAGVEGALHPGLPPVRTTLPRHSSQHGRLLPPWHFDSPSPSGSSFSSRSVVGHPSTPGCSPRPSVRSSAFSSCMPSWIWTFLLPCPPSADGVMPPCTRSSHQMRWSESSRPQFRQPYGVSRPRDPPPARTARSASGGGRRPRA